MKAAAVALLATLARRGLLGRDLLGALRRGLGRAAAGGEDEHGQQRRGAARHARDSIGTQVWRSGPV